MTGIRFSKPEGSLITKNFVQCVLYSTLQKPPADRAHGFCKYWFKKILLIISPALIKKRGKKKPFALILINSVFLKKNRIIEPKKSLSGKYTIDIIPILFFTKAKKGCEFFNLKIFIMINLLPSNL